LARLTNIKLRRSGTSGNVPTTSQLDLGELAINTYDGKLYLKKNVAGTESIVDIGGGGQTAVYKEYVYTATSNQTTFTGSDDNSQTLTYIPGYLQVFLNGVLLENGTDYTATSLTSVVLVNGASAGDILQISTFVKVLGTGDIVTDTFSGTGTTSDYTLSATPDNEDNIIVFVDGVYQEKSTYSVSGTTLTFDANLPTGVTAEVVIGSNNVTLTDIADLNISGNLGIGTTSPSGLLHVSSGTSGDATVIIESDTDNNDENDNPQLQFKQDGGNTIAKAGLTGSAGTIFTNSLSNAAYFGNDENASVQLYTNATAALTIREDGDVGIGSTTPSFKLHVDSGTTDIAGYFKSSDNKAAILIADDDTSTYVSAENSKSSIGANPGIHANNLNITSTGSIGIGATSPSAKLQVEEYGIDTTETSTTSTTQVAIHTLSATVFRSARFTVQVTNSTDSTYHLTEILMIHDGTTPSITEYGTIFTGSAEATFDADISSGNVRLLATPASTDSMEFKVVCHSITV